jgi:hypothetical protein
VHPKWHPRRRWLDFEGAVAAPRSTPTSTQHPAPPNTSPRALARNAENGKALDIKKGKGGRGRAAWRCLTRLVVVVRAGPAAQGLAPAAARSRAACWQLRPLGSSLFVVYVCVRCRCTSSVWKRQVWLLLRNDNYPSSQQALASWCVQVQAARGQRHDGHRARAQIAWAWEELRAES